eukprot:scaffold3437_cov31-Tisochrysis_lutea.AAC.2
MPIPTCAAWIIPTSLPPSPIAAVHAPGCVWRMSRTISAFCVGVQRQQSTAGAAQATSMNRRWWCATQSESAAPSRTRHGALNFPCG